MTDDSDRSVRDVLPPIVNQLLGASWVLLFAGRWTIVELLLAAHVLTPSMVSDLDDQILIRCYLVLLAVTITVVILRAMRSAGRRATERPAE